jgi:transposase
VALELSATQWKLAMTTDRRDATRFRTVAAGHLDAVLDELVRAKQRWGLQAEAPVCSIYEAGADGFWIHRWLTSVAVENRVVDPSSIEVPQGQRRRKTDRLDAAKLLHLLLRLTGGERAASVVHVPSDAAEDARHLSRALEAATTDRTRASNRILGLLKTQGVRLVLDRQFRSRLVTVRRWDGTPLPAGLQARIEREWALLEALRAQVRALERACDAATARGTDLVSVQARTLTRLRGVQRSARTFAAELFAWRQFRNGRQIGAVTGFAPTPYASGASRREQGISRAGRSRVRALAVQIAWGWLRYQRDSALSRWYRERFGGAGPRARRIGIVALARKLLIAFWRLVHAGEWPEGAQLKRA